MLVGYHLVGFDGPPASFRSVDHQLLQSADHRKRVEKFFSHTVYPINLIFFNARDQREVRPIGVNCRERAEYDIGKAGNATPEMRQQISAALSEHAVNFLARNNWTGDPIIPLTPWMIAHRMAHIPMVFCMAQSILKVVCQTALDLLKFCYGYEIDLSPIENSPKAFIYDTIYWSFMVPWGVRHRCPNFTDIHAFHSMLAALVTSRAGRQKLLTVGECNPEWFAQFIRFGTPRLPASLPETLDLNTCKLRNGDQFWRHDGDPLRIVSREREREILDRCTAGLKQAFNEHLNKSIGAVIIP